MKHKRPLDLPHYLAHYAKHNLLRIHLEGYYVFETDLEHHQYKDRTDPDIQFHKLDRNSVDLDEIVAFWPDYLRVARTDQEVVNTIRGYLDSGDECFCASSGDELAGMLWVGFENNHMLGMMAAKDGLARDEAIIHRGFVKPAFRGRKLHIAINDQIFSELQKRGIRRIRRYVGFNNIASIINNFKSNDRCRVLYHLEIVLLGRPLNFFPSYTTDSIKLKKRP